MAKKRLTAQSRYSRAAIKVRRQLKRLEGKAGSKNLIQEYRKEFPTLQELGNVSEKDLNRMARRAERLLEEKTLTQMHEAQIQHAIQTMHDRGYNFLNRYNFDYLFDFLDDARARGLASIYGYEAILEAVNRAQRRELTAEEIAGNIEYWTEHNKGQRLYVKRGRKPRSSSNDF